MYPTIAYRLGVLSPERWILGGLAILLILEATRRVAGWALVWVRGQPVFSTPSSPYYLAWTLVCQRLVLGSASRPTSISIPAVSSACP